jgi:phosphoglycerol transferase MdoB-like AlkP superfamily enzyme
LVTALLSVVSFSRVLKNLVIVVFALLFLLRIVELELLNTFGFGFSAAVFATAEWETTKFILSQYWLPIFFLFLFFGVAQYFFNKLSYPKCDSKREKIFTIIFFILLGTRSIWILNKESWHSRRDFASAGFIGELVSYYSSHKEFEQISWTENEIKLRGELGFEFVKYEDERGEGRRVPKNQLNLIFIYLEGFQANFTKIGGSEYKNLTPNLDKFASNYIFFSNFYNAATPTINAVISSQCGLMPKFSNSDLEKKAGYYYGVRCLPDILRDNGYYQIFMLPLSASFSGLDIFFKSHKFNAVQGKHELLKNYKGYKLNNWGFYDLDFIHIVASTLEKLKMSAPFHLDIITNDTHPPYYQHDDCPTYEEGNKKLNSIHCTDYAFGVFFKIIEEKGLLKNTVIFVMGDHMNHGSPDGQYGKVFTAMYHPQMKSKRVKTFSYTPDVAATLLEVLNFPINSLNFGRSIFTEREKYQHLIAPTFEIYKNKIKFAKKCNIEELPKTELKSGNRYLSACERKKLFVFHNQKIQEIAENVLSKNR